MTADKPLDGDRELDEVLKQLVKSLVTPASSWEFTPEELYKIHEQAKAKLKAREERIVAEARISELEQWRDSVHENTGNRGGASIRGFNTATRYYRENLEKRLAELKHLTTNSGKGDVEK